MVTMSIGEHTKLLNRTRIKYNTTLNIRLVVCNVNLHGIRREFAFTRAIRINLIFRTRETLFEIKRSRRPTAAVNGSDFYQ